MEKKLPENMTMINEDDLNNVSGGIQTLEALPLSDSPTQFQRPVLNLGKPANSCILKELEAVAINESDPAEGYGSKIQSRGI